MKCFDDQNTRAQCDAQDQQKFRDGIRSLFRLLKQDPDSRDLTDTQIGRAHV